MLSEKSLGDEELAKSTLFNQGRPWNEPGSTSPSFFVYGLEQSEFGGTTLLFLLGFFFTPKVGNLAFAWTPGIGIILP